MKRLLGRRGVAAAFVVVVAIAIAGIAYGSIPDANGVIHGCYRPTTGQLIVINSGKGCETGWTPLNWNQTGPTGATGVTGPTGPTGPTGALSSGFLYTFTAANQVVDPGSSVLSNQGLVMVASSGIYLVTLDLQGLLGAVPSVSLRVNGANVAPALNCGVSTNCSFTRPLSLNAGDTIDFANTGGSDFTVGIGSGFTIVRIA